MNQINGVGSAALASLDTVLGGKQLLRRIAGLERGHGSRRRVRRRRQSPKTRR